jgi:N-hydroxyarylamine O-acetyltransferase
VISADGTYGPPFDHMALLVSFAGGTRALADVGFGDSFIAPLDLDSRAEQHDRAGVFRIEEGPEWKVMALRDGAWRTEYLFSLDPYDLADYAPMCDWQQTAPQSPFRKKRVCTLATPEGRVTLTADRLITTRNGVREERAVSAQEWEQVLRETFGISRRNAGVRAG